MENETEPCDCGYIQKGIDHECSLDDTTPASDTSAEGDSE